MINLILIGIGVIGFIAIICAFSWYRIVSPSEAHLVISRKKKMIISSDDNIATDNKKTYFAVPSNIPFFGMQVRKMDLTIKEIVLDQLSYEQNQARFNVKSSTKYRINDVKVAGETFEDIETLQEQLKEVIVASTNAVASKYNVTDMRSKKHEMSEAIEKEMDDNLQQWGLKLINFQLVDFSDTANSKIISNLSLRREVEIEAETREQNAEKNKKARIAEAKSEEDARSKEIAKDQKIAELEENKKQTIAEQQKKAEEKRFEVVKVQTIKQAEIDKEKAIVHANQNKETEIIRKETKKLEGEGDYARALELAKAAASPIREKGLAEAEAKEKLQDALNKFSDEARKTLVAEAVVAKDQAIGVEMAKALSKADIKMFAGSGDSAGFDLGAIIGSMKIADDSAAKAVLNKIARPNDLGLSELPMKTGSSKTPKKVATATPKVEKPLSSEK